MELIQTMKAAQLYLQPALYTLLTADSALVALLAKDVRDGSSPGIFDAVPADQPFPYLVLGEFESSPFLTLTRHGEEVIAVMNAYSQDRKLEAGGKGGGGNKVLLDVLERLNTLLAGVTSITVANFDFLGSWYESANILKEVDGAGVITRHLIARYRMVMQQTP